jgi:hypothetical protein
MGARIAYICTTRLHGFEFGTLTYAYRSFSETFMAF